MKINSYIDKVLLAYFNGHANADETKTLMEWLEQSPENKKYFETSHDFWKHSKYSVEVSNSEQAFEKIKRQIALSHTKSIQDKPFNKQRATRLHHSLMVRIMAAAVLLLVTTASFYYFVSKSNENSVAINSVEWLKSENRAGEKSRIRLADGTIVWLNSDSYIEYPREYSNTERYVKLVGEAFFEVAKDTLRPFKVVSDDIVTTALGTSFNVQSYREEDEMIITLVTGKVLVSLDNKESFVLEPGCQIFYDKTGKSAVTKKTNVDNAIAWKEGTLVFERNSYEEVIKKLERWYGVNIITIGIPPADFTITGQFRRNESLEFVLETLNYGRQFEFAIEGKEIKLIF
jgi:transmembrane sensor